MGFHWWHCRLKPIVFLSVWFFHVQVIWVWQRCFNSETLSPKRVPCLTVCVCCLQWRTEGSHWNCSTDTSKNTTGHILICNYGVAFIVLLSKKLYFFFFPICFQQWCLGCSQKWGMLGSFSPWRGTAAAALWHVPFMSDLSLMSTKPYFIDPL